MPITETAGMMPAQTLAARPVFMTTQLLTFVFRVSAMKRLSHRVPERAFAYGGVGPYHGWRTGYHTGLGWLITPQRTSHS